MDEGTPIVPSIETQRLDLISRCVAGDEDAWRRFYNEYARILPAFIHDYRLPPDSVRQVVHDFMAHLFLKRCAVLGSYRLVAGARFESWLRIVFRRFTLRWLRTVSFPRWDSSLDPVDILDQQHSEEAPDPAAILAIYKILNKLDGRDGPLVSLMIEGRPYAEIGERLGMKEPAVAVAVQRMRRKLHRLLSKEGLDSMPQKDFSPGEVPRQVRDDHALPG